MLEKASAHEEGYFFTVKLLEEVGQLQRKKKLSSFCFYPTLGHREKKKKKKMWGLILLLKEKKRY